MLYELLFRARKTTFPLAMASKALTLVVSIRLV
jgi:hypothetical protein